MFLLVFKNDKEIITSTHTLSKKTDIAAYIKYCHYKDHTIEIYQLTNKHIYNTDCKDYIEYKVINGDLLPK